MKKVDFLIIGSGPCGLGAGYKLRELGRSFLILEKKPYLGGLSASFKDKVGFTWDIGGHILFSNYDYFNKVMQEVLPAKLWNKHQRESWIWIYNRFVPYPFQNNIHRLPEEIRNECFQGLIEASNQLNLEEACTSNFEQWMMKRFGRGISKHFLLPYNYKVWGYHPEHLDHNWISERVSVIDIDRVARNMKLNQDDVTWGPNNVFRFPKSGGTGAIWNSVADSIGTSNIQTEAEVISIIPDKKIAILKSGESVKYSNLLSTMPLTHLTERVQNFPEKLVDLSKGLKHSSTHVVGIGLKGKLNPLLKKKCWIYFPEDNCPFYRVTVLSNYSSLNVPDIESNYSLMAEVSESTHKKVNRDEMAQKVIQGLRNTKLISERDQIVSKWLFKAPFGYPTPCVDRDEILNALIPKLDGLGIHSRGRFGGWKYEVSNQDHSFMQGIEWVENILGGKKETTYTYSNKLQP